MDRLGRRRRVRPTAWSGPAQGPRVLVEHADHATAAATENVLRSAGYTVAGCEGPGPAGPCSLVADGSCAEAAEADVILYGLRVWDDDERAVLRELRRRHPDTPVVVAVPQPRLDDVVGHLDGCHVLAVPYTRATVRSAIDRALHDRAA